MLSSGRERARRGKAAVRLAAGRIARAAIQFAQRLQDGIDADRPLAIAEESEAQEARIARFSASVSDG
jgi:hypothetical protein